MHNYENAKNAYKAGYKEGEELVNNLPGFSSRENAKMMIDLTTDQMRCASTASVLGRHMRERLRGTRDFWAEQYSKLGG